MGGNQKLIGRRRFVTESVFFFFFWSLSLGSIATQIGFVGMDPTLSSSQI